jgi:flagellar biosynthesis/type III secretory pathway protein FliH
MRRPRFEAARSFTMRLIVVLLLAVSAVACTKSDERNVNAALSDANNKMEHAADKTGHALKKGYEKAKPELKQAGHEAGESLKDAGKSVKKGIHEATAPSDGDRADSE